MDEMIFLPEIMFQPNRMRKLFFMDELLSTLTTEPLQQVDNNIAEAVGSQGDLFSVYTICFCS